MARHRFPERAQDPAVGLPIAIGDSVVCYEWKSSERSLRS